MALSALNQQAGLLNADLLVTKREIPELTSSKIVLKAMLDNMRSTKGDLQRKITGWWYRIDAAQNHETLAVITSEIQAINVEA